MSLRSKIILSCISIAGILTGSFLHISVADSMIDSLIHTVTADSGDVASGSTLIATGSTTSKDIPDTRKITVSAFPKSGTYSGGILVTLTASDPKAQIWYTTNPNASPGDALKYKKPVKILESAPIYFFAYTSEQSESKVEKEEYIIIPVHTASNTGGTASTSISGSNSSGTLAFSGTGKPGTISTIDSVKISKTNSGKISVKAPPKALVGPTLKQPIKSQSGELSIPGSSSSSGNTNNSSSGETNLSGSLAQTPVTIDSLYQENTALQKDEFKKMLESSKTSALEWISSQTKTGIFVAIIGILLAAIVARFAINKRK